MTNYLAFDRICIKPRPSYLSVRAAHRRSLDPLGRLGCLEAVKIAVAPVVIGREVAVEGEPEIARASSHFHGNNRSPAAEAAVVVIKACVRDV